MRTTGFAVLAIVVALVAACGGGKDDAEPAEHTWYTSWDDGLAAAAKAERPVLVDFYAEWCSWCDVMDEETFSTEQIKRIFQEGWVTIRVDTDDVETTGTYQGQTLTYRDMAGAFGVEGLPSYLFLDKAGQPVTIIPGYIEKEPFGVILEYMHNEVYAEGVALNDYMQEKIGPTEATSASSQ